MGKIAARMLAPATALLVATSAAALLVAFVVHGADKSELAPLAPSASALPPVQTAEREQPPRNPHILEPLPMRHVTVEPVPTDVQEAIAAVVSNCSAWLSERRVAALSLGVLVSTVDVRPPLTPAAAEFCALALDPTEHNYQWIVIGSACGMAASIFLLLALRFLRMSYLTVRHWAGPNLEVA